MQPQTPTEPTPRPAVGMAVVDTAGEQAGVVTAVQPAGTDVRPDLAAGPAEELMLTGYVRVDGTGHLANDTYAGTEHIREVTAGEPGKVMLKVTREQLFRAL